jgi:alginate O-acetyltransferase complex protein AlgI
MDYVVGLGIERAPGERRRRAWLFASLAVNVGVLCYFKYFNFFITSASGFLEWIGLHTSLHTLKIILPYGVSFYTFQSMSYTIEVYRRHRPAERSFLDLAFFIAFFPQLVAGPIVRAMTFLPQTKVRRVWERDVDVRGALVQFMTGFVKKACVAETVAPFADQYFSAPANFTVLSAWIGTLLYAVQIYCDFSGYTDMAIATARLLGYELTVNFNFPYFAQNVTDFWRRWHISLSTWLRDYLYISLGGNRGSRLFTYRNLLLTMLLGGLWHGASWAFVIWGGLHGAALVAHREWVRWRGAETAQRWMGAVLGTVFTFYFTCVAWIFFRAVDLQKAKPAILAFVGFQSSGREILDARLLWLFAAIAFVHWLNYKRVFATWWRRGPDVAFAASYGAAAAIILLFIPQKYTPFIYFQF